MKSGRIDVVVRYLLDIFVQKAQSLYTQSGTIKNTT